MTPIGPCLTGERGLSRRKAVLHPVNGRLPHIAENGRVCI
jgi:hypothetical protein